MKPPRCRAPPARLRLPCARSPSAPLASGPSRGGFGCGPGPPRRPWRGLGLGANTPRVSPGPLCGVRFAHPVLRGVPGPASPVPAPRKPVCSPLGGYRPSRPLRAAPAFGCSRARAFCPAPLAPRRGWRSRLAACGLRRSLRAPAPRPRSPVRPGGPCRGLAGLAASRRARGRRAAARLFFKPRALGRALHRGRPRAFYAIRARHGARVFFARWIARAGVLRPAPRAQIMAGLAPRARVAQAFGPCPRGACLPSLRHAVSGAVRAPQKGGRRAKARKVFLAALQHGGAAPLAAVPAAARGRTAVPVARVRILRFQRGGFSARRAGSVRRTRPRIHRRSGKAPATQASYSAPPSTTVKAGRARSRTSAR